MRSPAAVRQACFACTTPYQIIGAAAIASAYGLQADLYIFGMFDNYLEAAAGLRTSGIFQNVYAVGHERFGVPGRLGGIVQMLGVHREMRRVLPDSVCYETLYISSRAHAKMLLQHELQCRNPRMMTVIYEDGLGSYLPDSSVMKTSKLRRKAERLLGWKPFPPEKTRVMLTQPQLADLPAELASLTTEKQPAADWNAYGDVLKNVFGGGAGTIGRRVIVFDICRGLYQAFESTEAPLDACYRVLAEVFGGENVICKPHPRSRAVTQADIAVYENGRVPMETLYANMPDLEERVLVCYNSTAVYTPKLMFDAEPTLILLHRIVDRDADSQAERLYRKFSRLYSRGNIFATSS